MTQQYVPSLGELPGPLARRDCVHVAVAPVVAAEALGPGEHVGLYPDRTATRLVEPVGVVDPFLTRVVAAGQRFWLFLYPGTVTSLRHVWQHPAFCPMPPAKE